MTSGATLASKRREHPRIGADHVREWIAVRSHSSCSVAPARIKRATS